MTPAGFSRRFVLAGCAALAGCRLYSDPPPVVIGGTAVSKDASVMEALRGSSEHARFVEALDAAGVSGDLEEALGPYTVFAPTDAAFTTLRPKSAAAQIAEDPGFVKQMLLNHIVSARLTSEDILAALPKLSHGSKVIARNNEVILLKGDEEKLQTLDMRKRVATIVTRDAIAANGIVHVIDNVLLPRAEAVASP